MEENPKAEIIYKGKIDIKKMVEFFGLKESPDGIGYITRKKLPRVSFFIHEYEGDPAYSRIVFGIKMPDCLKVDDPGAGEIDNLSLMILAKKRFLAKKGKDYVWGKPTKVMIFCEVQGGRETCVMFIKGMQTFMARRGSCEWVKGEF